MRILPSRPSALLRRLAFSLVTLVALFSVAETVPIAVATGDDQNDPDAVTNLRLSSESPGELTLSWAAPASAPSDYRLSWAEQSLAYLSYRDLNEPNRGNEYPEGQETSLTLTGLTKGATFKVQIRSRYKATGSENVLRSGPWTNGITVRIKDDPPAAATGLSASSVTTDSVTLTWTAPSSSAVTGYRVFRGVGSEARSVLTEDTENTNTTFTDSSVAAATQYAYSVLALSLDGNGAESEIFSLTTPAGLTDDTEKLVLDTDDQNDQNNVEVLAVTFPQLPSEHDGVAEFQMLLDFSHAPVGLGWRSVMEGVLSVQGASIGRLWRRDSQTDQFWGVMLTPDGYGDITVTINGTTNCSDQHAVCDADGLMLRGGEQEFILGPLTLSISEPIVQEDLEATLDFVVSLNRASDQAITVSYQTEDGTATAGADYTATSGSFTFDAGETEQIVSVPVLEDVGDNDRESVVFRLSSPSGAILADEYVVGTIIDLAVSRQQGDILGPPSLSVADALVLEGPGATLDFVVTLSHISDQAVTVTYRTKNGTGDGVARPDSDYHAASGSLTIDAGQTETTVSVRVREDEEQDGRETITLLLTSSVGATIADAEATGTILNTPKGRRLPAYYGHDRPDWRPGQIFPTSLTSTDDHTIDVAWATPLSYIALKFRINFAPVDPAFAERSFPWDGAETGNHWVHYPFATTTRLAGLTAGVEYKVRVQAQIPAIGQSPAWNGPWSRAMKVTVAGNGDAGPPPPLATASTVSSPTRDRYANGQLTSVTLTTSEPGNILVEWIPAPLPTGDLGRIPPDDYRVSWVKGDGPFPSNSDTAGNADVAGVAYTLTGLESGETYRVRVRANYPVGSLYLQPAWHGPWTELQIIAASPDPDPEATTTKVVVIPAVIPEPVVTQVPAQYEQGQLATLRLESPEAGNIDVSWSAPPLPTDQTPSAYHVNWAKDQEPYPDSTDSTGHDEVTGASHTLTGLESGQPYRVRVRADYPQGSSNAWTGPWTELEIVTATPEITASVTITEVTDTPEQLETATQSTVSTRALSAEAAVIPHDTIAFATYIPRVWVVAQHNLVQISWWRPADFVEYRIWRAPAGDSAYTVLAEGASVLLLPQPKGALSSRFYFTDTTVSASTSYKYAMQVLDTGQYSVPYEALASTTEYIAPRTTTTPELIPLPTNEAGDYLLNVGAKVSVTTYALTASHSFVLALGQGEAYRVELYDRFTNEGGHSHNPLGGDSPAFVGPIEPDPRSMDLNSNSSLEHAHGNYHISLGSITQIANGRTIGYESSDYRQITSRDWQLFWDGNLIESCCSGAQLSYVFHAPAAGDYRIQVRTDYGPTQYGVKVTRIGDHPDIPSFRSRHGFFTHGRINWGHSASVLGNIGVADQDWFAVQLEAGKSYRVSVGAGGRSGWQGLSNPRFVAMAGPDGVQVQPNFEGRTDRFRVTVPRDESGYYHFGVSGASSSDRGIYVFEIVEDDFPITPMAPVLNVGQHFIGMIESESDVDWIGAELTAGRTYRITVTGSYGDIRGRSFARFISLGSKVYNSVGNEVSLGSSFTKENAGHHGGDVRYLIGQVASARWSVATTGTYFFEIKKGGAEPGKTYGAYYFQITDITP